MNGPRPSVHAAAAPQRSPQPPLYDVPRSVFGWFAYLLASALGVPLQLALLALVGAAVFVQAVLPQLPDVAALRDVQYQAPLTVYSADGALIGEFGIQRRDPVALDEIPPQVIAAFLATEDSRFFEHAGVDTLGLGRALASFIATGEKTQGGSTITMQVVRNFFLTPEKTFQRKLTEILLTMQVERILTKRQILELYLNQIFFGHRTYGIAAAAELYYGKRLEQLTLAETAMLAGIPKAPSSGNPVTAPARALARRNHVLRRMLTLGYIDRPAYARAISSIDRARLHRHQPDLDAGYIGEMARTEIARFYGEPALSRGYRVITTIDTRLQRAAQNALRRALRDYDRRHGYRGPEARVDLAGMTDERLDEYLDGITAIPTLHAGVVTALDGTGAEVYLGQGRRARLAKSGMAWARHRERGHWQGPPRPVARTVERGDLIRLSEGPRGWRLSQIPRVGGALVALSPHDGAVRALVSGYAYAATKFNRAVEMRRQPGSTFKPFIYAAALGQGWMPASLIRDEFLPIAGRETWRPRNADRRELGPIQLRTALARSRNLATINLLQDIGLQQARGYMRRFGFQDAALPAQPSLALGTGVLSPVQLAEGYAVFANGGYRVAPYFIQRIEDNDGQVLFDAQPMHACTDCWYRSVDAPPRIAPLVPAASAERVVDPATAYRMLSMLREVIERGTGTRAKALERSDIFGKTGTTNATIDSWFAGGQADYVTVAWLGFDDPEPLGRGEGGGRAALGMWSDFMRAALAERPIAVLDPPPGVEEDLLDDSRHSIAGHTGEEPLGLLPEHAADVAAESGAGQSFGAMQHSASSASPIPANASMRQQRRASPRVMDDLF